MTDNQGVEKSAPIFEENKNVIAIEGVTETETSDFLEESGVVCENNKEVTVDFESDSDVINSFIQSTSSEVGYLC